jgi:AcrR family transcriptional regulator
MFSKFEALDEGKQQRIVNAAMREFALRGYDRASTNRIVEEAGIAKGLLFHYFRSKKQLFLYLYDRVLTWVTEEVFRNVDFSEADFFKRLEMGQRAKIALIRVYPDSMNFLKTAYLEESGDVKADLEARKGGLTMSFQKAFEGVDQGLFRDDLDAALAVKTIAWAYEGFANTYLDALRRADVQNIDYDALLASSGEYAEFLKKCFYKPDAGTMKE